uniref:Uncharacterized protein n=1 Tax=Tetranychus urticae TaxID=32264 RepID=T1KLU2_TETUR
MSSLTPMSTFSSTSSLHTSSPSPPSPSSSLLLSQSLSSSHNQHTQSSLTSLQTRVNEKSSQFNVQTTSQPGLSCRKPTRLSKRDLAIAPKLLDPEALSSPSPTAIEFLSRLREVITSARGRMRAFRFKPTLLVIPEDDYFIEEPESRYKSISSSIDSMNTSSLESYGEINRTDFQKYLIVGETLSLYPYGHDNFHSYSRSQHLQPLSLPAELSRHLTDKLKSWKLTDNQSSLSPNLSPISDGNLGSSSSSSNDISDPEVPQSPHRSQYHEKLQSNSSASPTYRSCEDSASVAWNNDNTSRVSRREIVDRLAEEIATNDSCEANNNAENDDHDNNEADSLNDLSDINENLFETNRSLGNMYDNITSENLVNLSNEVEKKLAQRSIVPLPEVVTNVNEGNKMKIADGIKSSSQHHSREDSKLSQLVADLKHFTRKRKQIKTSKSLPVVSDNNWMLQPVSSMSLRLSSSRSSRPSISSGQPGNRSMRNNSNFTNNGISRLNKNQTKFTANNKSEEMSQVIIQEGRYLNLNNHSPVSDDDRSIGNEITSSRCGLETWSLSSELSTGSSSPIYGKNIDNDSFGNQYILDTMAHHDEDEMFISFTGNQFESTLDDNEIGYISRFNLIKKYIDNPDNFDVKDAKKSDGINQSTERQKAGKDNISTNQIDATNHLTHAINSQSINQRRSIDYKHYQPSAQSLSSLTSTLPTSYSEMCSSDDGMSSASVSSIMFIESPNQGRRKSVDRRLTKGITERDDQSHYGNNEAAIILIK